MAEMHQTDSRCQEAWHDLRSLVDEELLGLPEQARTPLVLCYLEGKSSAQAARELGLPPGSVARQLARARELLRQRAAGRGLALSPGLLAALLADNGRAALPATLVAATVQAAMMATVATSADARLVADARGPGSRSPGPARRPRPAMTVQASGRSAGSFIHSTRVVP